MKIRVLSDEECDRIHEATLSVLARTGVGFAGCPQAHELFARHGCKVEDGRAFFPASVVAEALSLVPDRNRLAPFFPDLGYAAPISARQGETTFGLIGNAFYLHDYAAGRARDCVESDVNDKLLVIDSLPNFQYDCCNLFMASERGGKPAPRVYAGLEDCLAFLRRWVFGRAVPGRKKMPLGVRNVTPEEERLTVLGHAILEGTNATLALLNHRVEFTWCNPISPLQYKASEAESIMAVARLPVGWNSISPEVMLGGTGPVTMAGALVQHNAEVLAGVILSQFARAGSPCLYGCVSAPMDLRNAEISQGNFETALFNAAVVALADRYGLPSRISPGNTSDRKPGARALAETAIGLYLGAAAGGNIITTGLLDSTIMISYEHMVMVDELIGQVRGIAGGIATDADSLALEVIAQVGGRGGDYFSNEHTLANMKRDVYYSDFTGRIAGSYEDAYEKAHQRVKRILSRAEASDHVDKDILARLKIVEGHLKKDDQTWRAGKGEWWASYLKPLG
jgi:trimethylamine--corrinoid protein Co-methyltransferase